MKKIIVFFMLILSAQAFSATFTAGEIFSSLTVTGTPTVYSTPIQTRKTLSFDWKGSGTRVKGVFTLQASNDALGTSPSSSARWYDITKDAAGATITMAITSTGTTASGLIDMGDFNYRWARLKYVPDSSSATNTDNGTLESAYITRD